MLVAVDDPGRYADAKARENYSGMSPITRSALLAISALRLVRMGLLSRIESWLLVIVQRRLMGVKLTTRFGCPSTPRVAPKTQEWLYPLGVNRSGQR